MAWKRRPVQIRYGPPNRVGSEKLVWGENPVWSTKKEKDMTSVKLR